MGTGDADLEMHRGIHPRGIAVLGFLQPPSQTWRGEVETNVQREMETHMVYL